MCLRHAKSRLSTNLACKALGAGPSVAGAQGRRSFVTSAATFEVCAVAGPNDWHIMPSARRLSEQTCMWAKQRRVSEQTRANMNATGPGLHRRHVREVAMTPRLPAQEAQVAISPRELRRRCCDRRLPALDRRAAIGWRGGGSALRCSCSSRSCRNWYKHD